MRMEITKEIITFTGQVVALGVIIEKIVSALKNWRGSPEIQTVQLAISTFAEEMKNLNQTIRKLGDKL